MIKTILKSVAGILILLLFAVACKHETKVAPPLLKISVAYPEKRDIVYKLEYPGYLESEQTVDLVARVQGTLQEVRFKAGQSVKAGEVLFVIEPSTYEDHVKTAEANLRTAKANLAFAVANNKRIREASQSNAVSEIDVIQAQTEVDLNRAAVSAAEAQLNSSRTALSYCYVRAPFSGRISRNFIDRGNLVGNGEKLATMYKDHRLYVYFNVEDSRYFADFINRKDTEKQRFSFNKVELQFSEKLTKTYSGEIDYLAPNVDLSTGTINLRAIIENDNGELRSGMYVKLLLPYRKVADALLVPEGAIGTDQSGRFVYVLDDSSRTAYRHVKVGALQDDNMREITEGLTEKEQYVTKGLVRVRDGQKVEPVKEP